MIKDFSEEDAQYISYKETEDSFSKSKEFITQATEKTSASLINKLKQDIASNEKYIEYLEIHLASHQEEIAELKNKISQLQSKLKSANDYISLKEETLICQDKHILELIEENNYLKNRITELININANMSRSRPTSITSVLNNLDNNGLLAEIQNQVGRIRDTLSNRRNVPISQLLINETGNGLDRILTSGNIFLTRLIHADVETNRFKSERDQARLERDQAITDFNNKNNEEEQLRADLEVANHTLAQVRLEHVNNILERDQLKRERDIAFVERDQAQNNAQLQINTILRNILADSLPRDELTEITNPIETMKSYLSRYCALTINLLNISNDRDEALRNLEICRANGILLNRQLHQQQINYINAAQAIERNMTNVLTIKNNRITIILRDIFALQLLNRRHKAEADLAEFNRAWVFNKYQKWKAREINSRQIIFNLNNNPLVNMANMVDVNRLLTPQLASLPFYDGQEEPDLYYAKLRTINESARPLAVAAFNALARSNIMKGKMTGRFHPVPANNPFNGGNAINSEAEFLNWLQGKYREIMVGTNRDALRSLMTEKFSTIDTADTYEKRIKPYVQGFPFADVLPYLYEHMPQYMEMRLRQANPANLDAFFTDLRRIWLESRDRIAEQSFSSSQILTSQPQKEKLSVRLARDLQYLGIEMDEETLEKFIYEELGRRLGGKTAHIRKSPFTIPQTRNTYATKKVVKKVVPKINKAIRHCSICGRAGHTKVNCPRIKRIKKVNYAYQSEPEDPEESEEEYIVEEEEENVVEEDDSDEEMVDEYFIENDDETQNCFAIKKKNWIL